MLGLTRMHGSLVRIALVGGAGGAVGLVGAVGGMAGCSSGEDKSLQPVSPVSFRTGPVRAVEGGAGAVVDVAKPVETVATGGGMGTQPAPVERRAPRVTERVQQPMVDGHRVVAVVDQPPRAIEASTPKGRDVLADCMVGQINGRPVFASEVLDPMDGQLNAASKDVKGPDTAQKWIRDTARLIRGQVESRVRDELLLGEARARLTPEQKQGLIYFLQRVDQWASGQQGGSRVEAEEAIAARTGESYDKFLQSQRDQVLIRELIKDNVSPGVRVPWRKVERFYLENEDVINPPPRGVVRIVMVDGANAESVEKAQKAAGDSDAFRIFAASSANVFDREHGGEVVRSLDKPLSEVQWVANRAWNKAIETLPVGSFTGPIDAADYKVWIRREADVVSPKRTLEDAQLDIVTVLLKTKENTEQAEFFSQLLGKGSFTPISRMTLELLVLAAQRHLPPEIAGAVRDANPLGEDKSVPLERAPALPVLDDLSVNPPSKAKPKPKADEPEKP